MVNHAYSCMKCGVSNRSFFIFFCYRDLVGLITRDMGKKTNLQFSNWFSNPFIMNLVDSLRLWIFLLSSLTEMNMSHILSLVSLVMEILTSEIHSVCL